MITRGGIRRLEKFEVSPPFTLVGTAAEPDARRHLISFLRLDIERIWDAHRGHDLIESRMTNYGFSWRLGSHAFVLNLFLFFFPRALC